MHNISERYILKDHTWAGVTEHICNMLREVGGDGTCSFRIWLMDLFPYIKAIPGIPMGEKDPYAVIQTQHRMMDPHLRKPQIWGWCFCELCVNLIFNQQLHGAVNSLPIQVNAGNCCSRSTRHEKLWFWNNRYDAEIPLNELWFIAREMWLQGFWLRQSWLALGQLRAPSGHTVISVCLCRYVLQISVSSFRRSLFSLGRRLR